MLRRDFTRALGALAVASSCVEASETGTARPPFWMAQERRARVYLLGFGEAHDRSWFTPAMQRAFESSSHLWLELDQSRPPTEMNAVVEQYGRDPSRKFLDALAPPVRERALAYMQELDIKPESIETMRPWFAYYTFASAFAARKKDADALKAESPEAVLAGLARQASKKIGYEKSMAGWVKSLAEMPDKAQSQYIQWLFDYFDERKAGPNDAGQGWIVGDTAVATKSLSRMRALPGLYRVMQDERNTWWARKIVQLLQSQQIHFVAVGLLHVLGPDGIPRELDRLGVQLTENPRV